ncbi:AMP-binding protein [Sabulilitoribacter multivorans]|uniref:AMP-binding protein n=1 Tax=Flaviramulus multivorans TaxID=1304750 RepID=A0ABS9IHM7_9FLAO|nr:AMP-binding protein [Flaviramulus multivorans]MCF7560073.1 AMP-binding protein [Flaviramulus multivorans]
MTPNYTNVHNRFKLNGFNCNRDDLQEVAYSYVKEGLTYQQEIGNFLLDWLDDKYYIKVKTSGSTGKPKSIKIMKQAMVNSAIATGDFFKLEPGDKALHCLPTEYIAGKMMLIRAIILGLELDLVEPTSKPKFNTKKTYDFCAMIPLQLQNSLDSCKKIKTIIVGGSAVSTELKNQLQNLSTQVYETYGMTETVTHVAAKKLNNFNTTKNETEALYFKTLPNITISKDQRDCLVISAPQISNNKIRTNDIIEAHSPTEFQWLGRFDNIINSGGVKLYPEQIEAKLKAHIKTPFFITSLPHKTLGNKVVLVLEGESNQIDISIFNVLEKFEKPKNVFAVEQFVKTSTGKIQRKKTLKKLNL